MKTNAITFKEGKAFTVCEEIPKEPDWYAHKYWIHDPIAPIRIPNLYENDLQKYRSALQRVKDNATLIREEDQEKTTDLLIAQSKHITRHFIKEGEFYPLSVEVKIIQACSYDCCPDNGACEHCQEPKSVARIVEEPAIEKIDRFIMDKLIKYPPKVEEPSACNKCFDWKECVEFGCQKPDTKKDSEVEDQEELWKELIDLYDSADRESYGYSYLVNRLKEKFSITRIKQ